MPLDPTLRIFRPHRRPRALAPRLALAALLFGLPSLQGPMTPSHGESTGVPGPIAGTQWETAPLVATGMRR